MLEIRGILQCHMSWWDQYVLCPQIWTETSRSGTVPHIGPYKCDPSCPIILGRPFLRTVGAIIDMKEGTIRFQFSLKKGMEHFPRKKIKLPFESVTRASYSLEKT